jgi:hypothetical protein
VARHQPGLVPAGLEPVAALVDGVQHYADTDGRAKPRLYAEMVAEDRRLRLTGYEVYRFGGYEFVNRAQAGIMLNGFFRELLQV